MARRENENRAANRELMHTLIDERDHLLRSGPEGIEVWSRVLKEYREKDPWLFNQMMYKFSKDPELSFEKDLLSADHIVQKSDYTPDYVKRNLIALRGTVFDSPENYRETYQAVMHQYKENSGESESRRFSRETTDTIGAVGIVVGIFGEGLGVGTAARIIAGVSGAGLLSNEGPDDLGRIGKIARKPLNLALNALEGHDSPYNYGNPQKVNVDEEHLQTIIKEAQRDREFAARASEDPIGALNKPRHTATEYVMARLGKTGIKNLTDDINTLLASGREEVQYLVDKFKDTSPTKDKVTITAAQLEEALNTIAANLETRALNEEFSPNLNRIFQNTDSVELVTAIQEAAEDVRPLVKHNIEPDSDLKLNISSKVEHDVAAIRTVMTNTETYANATPPAELMNLIGKYENGTERIEQRGSLNDWKGSTFEPGMKHHEKDFGVLANHLQGMEPEEWKAVVTGIEKVIGKSDETPNAGNIAIRIMAMAEYQGIPNNELTQYADYIASDLNPISRIGPAEDVDSPSTPVTYKDASIRGDNDRSLPS